MTVEKVEYDRFGRMKYNPIFHPNNGTPWSEEDLSYLINWYDIIGPTEMSFALERTAMVVAQKVTELRKKGVMKSGRGKKRMSYYRKLMV